MLPKDGNFQILEHQSPMSISKMFLFNFLTIFINKI